MAENTAFSASGEEVISRTIELDNSERPQELTNRQQFEEFYDIERTAQEIIKGNYQRVALQFPDELLGDSVPIFRALKSRIGSGRDLYVLADTSYGSCCVDEVASQHVNADAMVHYGHACMSQTSRLPVIYVFGKRSVDIDDCTSKLVDVIGLPADAPGTVLLRIDVAYCHLSGVIVEKLHSTLPPASKVLYAQIPLTTYPAASQPTDTSAQLEPQHEEVERSSVQSTTCDTIAYIGGESLALTNLLLTHSTYKVYSYDPRAQTARLESGKTNRLLMRRYAAVQKARDADVFGILVGTLGVTSYLPLISKLRSLLTCNHKKSYTISVGKLNPAKLGNFLEIECFVLVACPENSLIEAKDFLRPIVTPYELEIALQSEPTWTGEYILDFGKLSLEGHTEHQDEEPDLDRPTFSLVTGTYRQAKRYGDTSAAPSLEDSSSSAVIVRNQDNTVSVLSDSAAGHFLQTRTYRGLETRVGEDAPSILEQGRSGIARGYTDDHH